MFKQLKKLLTTRNVLIMVVVIVIIVGGGLYMKSSIKMGNDIDKEVVSEETVASMMPLSMEETEQVETETQELSQAPQPMPMVIDSQENFATV